MSNYEVPQPILNSPYDEPRWHWWIEEGQPCETREGRRPSVYYYRPPRGATGADAGSEVGTAIEMTLVNHLRERVKAWREAGWPGVTRTTEELLRWWQREGRQFPLFFAQREAAETIIFLTEARAHFRQGLKIPRDDPSDDKKAQGYLGFTRYACKMATGSGKTTVMGMLAAWSILNKVHNRSDGRFSDVVFIVCPNITIRDRLQELEFELATALTRDYVKTGQCSVPAQALFPQLLAIVQRYLREFVRVYPPNDLKDIFLSPYYGWVIEKLVAAIRPDTSAGEAPEVPRYEANRPPGSTRDVDFWTSREVREVTKSHLNYVVMDTQRWEQSAAYYLDRHPNVAAFVKNSGLGFAIPYLYNGQVRDFIPDYLVRLHDNGRELGTLILEVKGYDPLANEKQAAALRWCAAVNADGQHGRWTFAMVKDPSAVRAAMLSALKALAAT